MKPRILLADDHALLLDAFEKLLADSCDIVGVASDGRAAVDATESLKPEVVVLDIGMPGLNGLEAGREIKRRRPSTKIVFLTMNEDPDMAAEAFRLGASGFVLKRSAVSELIKAIGEVVQGRSYVTPLVTEGLVNALIHESPEPPRADRLTVRQREVLRLIAEGSSMKHIASILSVTPRTVAFHKYQMMNQLKIRSTPELIRYAVKHHIV
jgi:DNA-binding NarL/FixJ family response regulator